MGRRDEKLLKININRGIPQKNVRNNPYSKSKLALDAAKWKERAHADYKGEYMFQEPNVKNDRKTKEKTEGNKGQVTTKRSRASDRTTKTKRLANLRLLEVIRKTKESISAIRAKASKTGSELVPITSSNVLPVTVSVIQGKSLMVSKHILKQTGSVEEEEAGVLPLESKICFST